MLTESTRIKPLIKWVGGKTHLLKKILPKVPLNINTYYEPFFGGGAVFFALSPEKAVINDANLDLTNMYHWTKAAPVDFFKVFEGLFNAYLALSAEKDVTIESAEPRANYYYEQRELFREEDTATLCHAARFLFLGRTSFNGLVRYSKKSGFNSPHGRHKKIYVPSLSEVRGVAKAMSKCSTLNKDFQEVVSDAKPGDFIYFDPPYIPANRTANFKEYSVDGFSWSDHVRLKEECDRLTAKGVKWLLSNSDAPEALNLYDGYKIDIVQAARSINCKSDKRGKVNEILVRNYQ